jgi:predicted MFS family arabinose efflux permease
MDDLNRPYRRNRSSALAAVFNSSLTSFSVALGALMPIIRSDLGMSLTLASFHFTLIAALGMVGSSITPRIGSRLGRHTGVLITLVAVIVSQYAFALAPNVALTLAASVIYGLVGTIGLILTQAEMMDQHPRHRAAATAELTLIVSVCMFLATIGAGQVVELFDSWRVVILIAPTVLVVCFYLVRGMQWSDAQPGSARTSSGTMTPLAWLFCVLIVAQTGFEWCYGYLGAEFMNKAGGLSKSAAAASLSLYYAGLVVGRFFLVPAVRRFSGQTLLMTSFAGATVGFLMLAAGPDTWMKLAGLFVSGLGISFSCPILATLAAAAFPTATDWIIGRLYTFGGFAIAAAPFAVGALGDAVGIGTSFWAVGLLAMIGLVATPFMSRLSAPEKQNPLPRAN